MILLDYAECIIFAHIQLLSMHSCFAYFIQFCLFNSLVFQNFTVLILNTISIQ